MTAHAELPFDVETGPGAESGSARTAFEAAAAHPRVRPAVLRAFRKHTASVLSGVFAGSAFDQVAMVPVAAAVDRSGRFAANFADRGVRSGASAVLALWADPVDRLAEADWQANCRRTWPPPSRTTTAWSSTNWPPIPSWWRSSPR